MANVFHAFRLTKFALFLIALISVLLILSRRNNFGHINFIGPNGIDGGSAAENSESPGKTGNHHQLFILSRTMIVQRECLLNLAVNKKCQFPIEVALFITNSSTIIGKFNKNPYLKISWLVEDRPEKDYWLFREAKNGTNAIAMKRLTTAHAPITFGNGAQYLLEIPTDLAKFQQKWQNGRFMECQIVLRRNETDLKRFLPLTMVDRGAELSALMDQFNVTGFIMGGTLLGWRRECSLIPHTGDLDFAILAHQHSLPFLRSILHSEKFLLKWILGHPKKGFELTLWMDNFKTDIFYIYYNATRDQSYLTGMRVEKKQRLYWHYPRVEKMCTGEMGGHLFNLPCNVDEILAAEYGAEAWKVDFPTSQFSYDKSAKNKESGEILSDVEWELQYNLYYPKGEHNQTLPKWDE